MRIFIIILSLMCFGQILAQGAFYYSHIQPYSNHPFSIAEFNNGFFIVGNNISNGHSNGFMMMMDKTGGVKWDKIIDDSASSNQEQYRSVTNHNGFFFIGGFRRFGNNRKKLLLKINPVNGNILESKIFDNDQVLAGDNLIEDIHPNQDGLLIATSGFDSISMSTVAQLIQVDLDFNILWERQYSADISAMHFSDRIEKISPMKNGLLLIMNSLDVSEWQTNYYILRTDTEGNEIWRKSMLNYQSSSTVENTILSFNSATTFKQNKIITLFSIDNVTDSSYSQNLVLIEFDESGNEIFYKKHPENDEGIGPSDIFSDENNIYILGRQEVTPPYYSQLYAAKLDSEKEFLWSRHYGEKDIAELYFCGTLTSDGGVLIGGRDLHFDFGSPYYNSILVKTDCEGNTEWNYESCMSPELDEVNIFPNPFSNYVNIHIPNLPEKSEVKIKLYNTVGKLVDNLVYNETDVIQVNTNKYAKGLYHCIIEVNGTVIANKKVVKAE